MSGKDCCVQVVHMALLNSCYSIQTNVLNCAKMKSLTFFFPFLEYKWGQPTKLFKMCHVKNKEINK